jgi:hypothetical protein
LKTTLFAVAILLSTCQAQAKMYVERSSSRHREPPKSWQQIKSARAYLVASQNPDGSWGSTPNRMRETSLALLGFTNSNVPGDYRPTVLEGTEWLLAAGEPTEADLIAIRLIALAELVNQGGDNIQPKVIQMMKTESVRLNRKPSRKWLDLLAIAPFPKGVNRPRVVPRSWTTYDFYLNKGLKPEDLAGIQDLRTFVLKTFASAIWSGPNSMVSAKAKYDLWQKQQPDGSFPQLAGAYGAPGATGLMFLVNKTWMHTAYRYLWAERHEAQEKGRIKKETSNQSIDIDFQ